MLKLGGNENSDISINEIFSDPKNTILTPAQKYRNLPIR